jgi:hypothetical protein
MRVCPKKYWWSQNIPHSPNISTLWGYTLGTNSILKVTKPWEGRRRRTSGLSLKPRRAGPQVVLDLQGNDARHRLIDAGHRKPAVSDGLLESRD